MASFASHGIVASAIGSTFPERRLVWRVIILGIILSILPDADSIGFAHGIPYESVWGHRGITHSLFFALFAAIATSLIFFRKETARIKIWAVLYLFIITASHGVLDAITNGGLGIAFFAPFINDRYFFTFNPVEVAPIFAEDLNLEWIIRLIKSEFTWIWLPSLVFAGLGTLLRKFPWLIHSQVEARGSNESGRYPRQSEEKN